MVDGALQFFFGVPILKHWAACDLGGVVLIDFCSSFPERCCGLGLVSSLAIARVNTEFLTSYTRLCFG